MKNEYWKRVADGMLNRYLKAFGAVQIVGPKWCGKTTTALSCAKSALKLQDSPDKEALLYTASINPSVLLGGEHPRLIDEWQDAPAIWDAVRSYCDDHRERGLFILTGSTSQSVNTAHSGTGRIARMTMYPMSLYESRESNGSVSLSALFSGEQTLENGCHSDLKLEDLIYAACRGGWPESVTSTDKESNLLIPQAYIRQICEEDIRRIDGVSRSPRIARQVISSYARNISTLAKKRVLITDAESASSMANNTFDDYLEALEKLFIVQDLYGWSPSIRSASAMRSGRKRELVDPSLAVAALGASPKTLSLDLKTFGFVFETLCIRDLRIYSSALGGELSYYHDSYGLEADCVLHLSDGEYALIEFKLGQQGIDEGAKHLCAIEDLIRIAIKQGNDPALIPPKLKMVVTAGEFGYRRPDGVLVVPIGCLKD